MLLQAARGVTAGRKGFQARHGLWGVGKGKGIEAREKKKLNLLTQATLGRATQQLMKMMRLLLLLSVLLLLVWLVELLCWCWAVANMWMLPITCCKPSTSSDLAAYPPNHNTTNCRAAQPG